MRQSTVIRISFHSFLLGSLGGLSSSYWRALRGAKVTGFPPLHCSSIRAVFCLDMHIIIKTPQSTNPNLNPNPSHYFACQALSSCSTYDASNIHLTRVHREDQILFTCHIADFYACSPLVSWLTVTINLSRIQLTFMNFMFPTQLFDSFL